MYSLVLSGLNKRLSNIGNRLTNFCTWRLKLIFFTVFMLSACNLLSDWSGSWLSPTRVPDTQYIPNKSYPEVVHHARFILSQQLQVSPESIYIQSVESVIWPNSCLGISLEGIQCDSKPVEGYRITFDVLDKKYIYHTDHGNLIHLAAAPNNYTDETIIEWNNAIGMCSVSKISLKQISFGECGAPMLTTRFSETDAIQDLRYFWQTYASFTAKTSAGNINFKGQGKIETTLAEKRMIGEWSKMTTIAAQAGRTGAAWGNAITWRRNDCAYLTIFTMGYAISGTCNPDISDQPIKYWLSSVQLEQLYAWHDQYEPFEIYKTPKTGEEKESVYVLFSGAGSNSITEIESQMILKYASDLFKNSVYKSRNK